MKSATLAVSPSRPPSGQYHMVQVTWGNILSIVLPGFVIVLASTWVEPVVAVLVARPHKLTAYSAACLVILATLAGGVIDAMRRCTLDLVLSKTVNTERPSIFAYLTPENHAMYQTGVENSYKYYAFYENLTIAVLILIAVRLYYGVEQRVDLVLWVIAVACAAAGYIQYLAYEGRTNGFIAEEQRRRRIESRKGGTKPREQTKGEP